MFLKCNVWLQLRLKGVMYEIRGTSLEQYDMHAMRWHS